MYLRLMLSDLWLYAKNCIRLSWKGAWNWTENFFGNVVVSLISLAVAWYFKTWFQAQFTEDDVRDFVTWAGSVVVTFGCFFVIRVVFIAPFQAWRQQRTSMEALQLKLDEAKKGPTKLAFDMSAPEVASYVSENLGYDAKVAGEFVARMVFEKQLSMRAIERDGTISCVVDPKVFEPDDPKLDFRVFLIGTDKLRDNHETFGMFFDERGWIQSPFNYLTKQHNAIYVAPRFISREVEKVVEWYKKSRP